MSESKTTKLGIGSIIKKIDKQTIRFDHPLQRHSDQWSKLMVGNLISDILQKNPIPALVFAEQIVNGIPIVWDLDGKQRCTNVYNFVNCVKGFEKIHKKVTRYMIEYHVPVLDEDGNPTFDEENFPIYERKEFDIRGKKFSELPDELQERFLDYSFEIVQYLDCSSEDIAYHIARYNEGKPMSVPQKGITRLGANFAEMVRSISTQPFFKEYIGNYKDTQFKNGVINRVIVESVMSTRFLESWEKDYGDMCQFLKSNASQKDFDYFNRLVERLEDCISDEASTMFNQKDSFLWFSLFSTFSKLQREDTEFIEFLEVLGREMQSENRNDLCSVELDGVTLNSILENKSTKDKSLVVGKIKHLIKLMCYYIGIDDDELNVALSVHDDKDCIGEESLSFEMESFLEEHRNTGLPNTKESLAFKSLMGFCSNFPIRDFKPETIKLFSSTVVPTQDEAESCLYASDVVANWLSKSNSEHKFSENDIAILVGIVDKFEEVSNHTMIEWMRSFVNDDHKENSNESGDILHKEGVFIQSINNFINGGE